MASIKSQLKDYLSKRNEFNKRWNLCRQMFLINKQYESCATVCPYSVNGVWIDSTDFCLIRINSLYEVVQ